MKDELPSIDRRMVTHKYRASTAVLAVCSILLLGVAAVLFFPDTLLNRCVRPLIVAALTEAHPAYSLRIESMSYRILKNRFQFDSVVLSDTDGISLGSVQSLSVSGSSWIHLLWGGRPALNDFARAVIDAKGIVLSFPQSHYTLRCKELHISVPDSVIVADSVLYHPSGEDEQFFAGGAFRKTRTRAVVPFAGAAGVACLEAAQGIGYRARSLRIESAFLDLLVNKDKSDPRNPPGYLMPGQILSSIQGPLHIDTVRITEGRLNYGERFGVGLKPGVIAFDSMQGLVEGIANHGEHGDSIVIHARGRFMKAGTMAVRMSFPVGSPAFSYRYTGSQSAMDAAALNAFLETAEQIRIKGILQSAVFSVTIDSGHARGTVRVVYKNVSFAFINRLNRSDKGLSDIVASLIANTFKIRGTNLPDSTGAMKIGMVKYTQKPEDPFFRFTWFTLRSGVGDVVGF